MRFHSPGRTRARSQTAPNSSTTWAHTQTVEATRTGSTSRTRAAGGKNTTPPVLPSTRDPVRGRIGSEQPANGACVASWPMREERGRAVLANDGDADRTKCPVCTGRKLISNSCSACAAGKFKAVVKTVIKTSSPCSHSGYEYIQSAEECKAAFAEIAETGHSSIHIISCSKSGCGLPHATSFPPGCYIRSDKKWFYNSNIDVNSRTSCDRGCICRAAKCCTTCRTCAAASTQEKSACTATADRVCECKAGFDTPSNGGSVISYHHPFVCGALAQPPSTTPHVRAASPGILGTQDRDTRHPVSLIVLAVHPARPAVPPSGCSA